MSQLANTPVSDNDAGFCSMLTHLTLQCSCDQMMTYACPGRFPLRLTLTASIALLFWMEKTNK
jgi:hypothetical protein